MHGKLDKKSKKPSDDTKRVAVFRATRYGNNHPGLAQLRKSRASD